MTNDKIKALDELIAAAGEGTIARSDLDAFIPSLGLTTQANDAHSAYKGSLDAAKALHDALLPEWVWKLESYDGLSLAWVGHPSELLILQHEVDINNPARAWLVAILKAYKSTLST